MISNVKIKVFHKPGSGWLGGEWQAIATVFVHGRKFTFTAYTTAKQVLGELLADIEYAKNGAASAGDASAGSLFSWLGHAVEDAGKSVGKAASGVGKFVKDGVRVIAESKVVKAVAKGIGTVLKSPVVAGIVGVVSVAIPGVGAAIGASYVAMRAAYALAEKVSDGDPSAIASVAEMATSNSPDAKRAVGLVADAIKAPQKVKDAVLGTGIVQAAQKTYAAASQTVQAARGALDREYLKEEGVA